MEFEWDEEKAAANLDSTDEPASSPAMQAEKKRVASGKIRFTILTKDKYDRLNPGDTFTLKYQRFSDDELMIW